MHYLKPGKPLLVWLLLMVPCLFANAQSGKKYNSLLWEIKGPGIAKTSYLYGTMHVSKKLAFNLSDTFYLALEGVDAVALEQDPSTWMDEMVQNGDLLGRNPRKEPNGFSLYSAFAIDSITEEILSYYLSRYNGFANDLLYRNSRNTEFEEDTYLDLFIYQGAAKAGKPVYGLEDFQEVEELNRKAIESADKADRSEYYEYGYDFDFDDFTKAYRDGDLDALDSMQRMQYKGSDYNYYMLDVRNVTMADHIDSIIKTGKSLFVGVGAAHLPSETGVIELLRKKGYSVRAIPNLSTELGRKKKQEMESRIRDVKVSLWMAPDSLFRAPLPGKPYVVSSSKQVTEYFLPEMTNGVYYSITRLNTFAPLFGLSSAELATQVDKLLYENIPGKILTKETTQKGDTTIIQLTNETRNGDYQLLKIYVTPVNIVLAKVSGPSAFGNSKIGEDFLKGFTLVSRSTAGTVSNPNLSFKTMTGSVSENFILMPETYSGYANAQISNGNQYEVALYANYHDVRYIEEDEFELKFMIEKFALSVNAEIDTMSPQSLPNGPGMAARLKDRNNGEFFHAVMGISGSCYMLLCGKGLDSLSLVQHLSSISYANIGVEAQEEFVDTALHFRAMVPQGFSEYNNRFSNIPDYEYNYYSRRKSDTKRGYYSDPHNNEVIRVTAYRLNKYTEFKDLEELKDKWGLKLKEDKNKNRSQLFRISEDETDQMYRWEGEYRDSLSSRNRYETVIIRDNLVYYIEFASDTVSGKSAMADLFLSSFTITDTVVGISPFTSKKEVFMQDIYSTDSATAVEAYENAGYLKFREDNIDMLAKLIEDDSLHACPHFQEEYIKYRFVDLLGRIDDYQATEYLYNLYKNNPDSSELQQEVISALIYSPTKNKVEIIKNLFSEDFPMLPGSSLSSMFKTLHNKPEEAAKLIPNLLKLTRSTSYREKVYILTATLLEDKVIKPSVLKKEIRNIVMDANEEIRRRLMATGYDRYDYSSGGSESFDFEAYQELLEYIEQADASGEEAEYLQELLDEMDAQFNRPDLLSAYMIMLSYYRNDPGARVFFERVQRYIRVHESLRYQTLLYELGMLKDETVFRKYAESASTRAELYTYLKKRDRMDLFDSTYLNQQDMALAYLSGKSRYDSFEEDSITFLERRFVECKGGKDGFVYFFKRSSERGHHSLMFIGLLPADGTSVDLKPVESNTRYRLKSASQRDIDEAIDKTMLQFKLHDRDRSNTPGYGNYDFSDYSDYEEFGEY
jgi:uncharacterized protein YbaP (TraB family)